MLGVISAFIKARRQLCDLGAGRCSDDNDYFVVFCLIRFLIGVLIRLLDFLALFAIINQNLVKRSQYIVHRQVSIILIDLVVAHIFQVLTHLHVDLLYLPMLSLQLCQQLFLSLEFFLYFTLFQFSLK